MLDGVIDKSYDEERGFLESPFLTTFVYCHLIDFPTLEPGIGF